MDRAIRLTRDGKTAVVSVESPVGFFPIIRESLSGWPHVEFDHIVSPGGIDAAYLKHINEMPSEDLAQSFRDRGEDPDEVVKKHQAMVLAAIDAAAARTYEEKTPEDILARMQHHCNRLSYRSGEDAHASIAMEDGIRLIEKLMGKP